MSTTVTYKGSTLVTINNSTKTLKTAGKYLEDDITIVDSSSGGSAVTITDTSDVGGGTVRTITAVSLANDSVSASSLAYGVTAHDASGTAITGSMQNGDSLSFGGSS